MDKILKNGSFIESWSECSTVDTTDLRQYAAFTWHGHSIRAVKNVNHLVVVIPSILKEREKTDFIKMFKPVT